MLSEILLLAVEFIPHSAVRTAAPGHHGDLVGMPGGME